MPGGVGYRSPSWAAARKSEREAEAQTFKENKLAKDMEFAELVADAVIRKLQAAKCAS